MLKNISKSMKILTVTALMTTTLGTGLMAQAAGPGGPGFEGRHGDSPRMEQRMGDNHRPEMRDEGRREAPPRYRERDNDNSGEVALGIAAIAAAVIIANS